MAVQREIEATYDYMDEVIRRALGEHPDISCAFYDGDYSRTLEEAQRAKHEFVLASLGFRQGMRVLDIGCGWGPMLRVVRDRGGQEFGVTLSPKQAAACQRHGLRAELLDWNDMSLDAYGRFDAIVSIGAFEHFCSVEAYLKGRQDEIYRRFFMRCHALLVPCGRLYLQTMVWDRPLPYEAISLRAPKGSAAYLLALLEKFYPGSWLPYGQEQIRAAADGFFTLVAADSGRRDYIATMRAWRQRRIWRHALRPQLLGPLTARYLTSRDFRLQVASLRHSSNRRCFEHEIMDHRRMVFQRVEGNLAPPLHAPEEVRF
jgi:cyclopropane-fatty-acyl-phospholipid synthase